MWAYVYPTETTKSISEKSDKKDRQVKHQEYTKNATAYLLITVHVIKLDQLCTSAVSNIVGRKSTSLCTSERL